MTATETSLSAEIQAELAGLDALDDEALVRIARGRREEVGEFTRQDELLARNAEGLLDANERAELARFRKEQDLFMLRKEHAAALLRGRGRNLSAP